MKRISSETVEPYLVEQFSSDEVRVINLKEHTEGWSRDTYSLDLVYYDDDGLIKSDQLVLRAESEKQLADRRAEGMDIESEYNIMAAAQLAPVPTPDMYWFENDVEAFGRRFFVMEHLPGNAPVTWNREQRTSLYDEWDAPNRTLPEQFVDAAVGVHTLSASEVSGIESVPNEEVVDRELNRWEQLYRETKFAPEPALEEALRWFRANKPTIPETTVIHGDFRIGNMIINDGQLTGLLDWELSRCGDPMFDLGYASTRYFAGKLHKPIERPELACALLERDWFYDEYEARAGRTVDSERIMYWRAIGAFAMLAMAMNRASKFESEETETVESAWLQYIFPGLIEDILDIFRAERLPT